MKSVYLASRYSRHPEMRAVRARLQSLGIEVTSRWIDCHPDVVGDFTSSFTVEVLNERPEDCAPLGQHDLDDIERADTVISFTTGDGGKGGRHVEFGYGLALGKEMIVIGPREHVFHTLTAVRHFPNWLAFASALPPDPVCSVCSRDDRYGSHAALERYGHLDHRFEAAS